MRHSVHTAALIAGVCGSVIALSGCQSAPGETSQSSVQRDPAKLTTFVAYPKVVNHPLVRVLGAKKMDKNHVVELYVRAADDTEYGENIINLKHATGVGNYVSCAFPREKVNRVLIKNEHGNLVERVDVSSKGRVSQSVNTSASTFALGQQIKVPPPGVSIDHKIHPKASVHASSAVKADAVISVATSQDGTPYIWGENKDRGDKGFDCSNFVAYVYHHALGYHVSGSSNVQWDSVGITVPIWDMRKGDLLVFEHGKHVGIYSGNEQMIQCGGGIGKVGTLSLGPDSYWGKHLTGVRRMF